MVTAKSKTEFFEQPAADCQNTYLSGREQEDQLSTNRDDDSWCDDTAKLNTPFARVLSTSENARETNPSMVTPIMSADASNALRELEQMLGVKLKVGDSLDWDRIVGAEPFQPSLCPRSYIQYGEDGVPVDVEYLNMKEPKPEEPTLEDKPVASSFEPDIGIMDKLVFRQQRLSRDAHLAYMAALEEWESDRQQRMAKFVQENNRWMESAKAVDLENAKRYQQCLKDQQLWLEQKKQFDEKRLKAKASIENFRQAFLQNDHVAMQR